MTYGLQTWKADGTPLMTMADAGGVFVGQAARGRASGSGTITYSALNGSTLRVFQVHPGCFSWSTGVDGAGNPTLTFTLLPATAAESGILLLVFAI